MSEIWHPNLPEWVARALDGVASNGELAALNQELKRNPAARDYYIKVMMIHTGIKHTVGVSEAVTVGMEKEFKGYALQSVVRKDLQDSAIRRAIGQDGVEYSSESRPTCQVRRIFGRPDLERLLRGMAALLLLSLGLLGLDSLLYQRIQVEPTVSHVRLLDQTQAHWDDRHTGLAPGDKLDCGDIELLEGHAKLLFNSGARVVVEAPAALRLQTNGDLFVFSGRVSAYVPQSAKGFTVATLSGRVIDLGTEFGLSVDSAGSLALHMFSGRASLISYLRPQMALEVVAGQARQIRVADGLIETIDLRPELFVRDLSGQSRFVWRGQTVDLADVAGGGDGFGTGNYGRGIDVLTGMLTDEVLTKGDKAVGYTAVTGAPGIDGVFVPNGPAQVSSRQTLFADCPASSGGHPWNILNGSTAGHQFEWGEGWMRLRQTAVAGDRPALLMHANLGITYDLQALRQAVAPVSIHRFTAQCGYMKKPPAFHNEEEVRKYMAGTNGDAGYLRRSHFFVLVDGQVRFERRDLTEADNPAQIDIKLTGQDRFLTLIATDGSDQDFTYNWTQFCEPRLELSVAP